MTLLDGKLRLAWKGYSAGIALILDVDSFEDVDRLSNDPIPPPGVLGVCPLLPPSPPSSAQESQRLPWLPDWSSRKKQSIFMSMEVVSVSSLETKNVQLNLVQFR